MYSFMKFLYHLHNIQHRIQNLKFYEKINTLNYQRCLRKLFKIFS